MGLADFIYFFGPFRLPGSCGKKSSGFTFCGHSQTHGRI